MRELTIGKNDAGQRVDRFVSKALPLLPPALLQKYIRLKRIKVNGGRAQRDQRLQEGDVLQLYINDEFFDKPREDNLFLTLFRPSLDIVYEDENLMLLNKRPGLVVHADETEKVNTLINHIQAYLYQKREWNPRWENAFTPALCNRIDRNTGGIVIAAAHGNGRAGRAAGAAQHGKRGNQHQNGGKQANARQRGCADLRHMANIDAVHNVIQQVYHLRHHRGQCQLGQQLGNAAAPHIPVLRCSHNQSTSCVFVVKKWSSSLLRLLC